MSYLHYYGFKANLHAQVFKKLKRFVTKRLMRTPDVLALSLFLTDCDHVIRDNAMML